MDLNAKGEIIFPDEDTLREWAEVCAWGTHEGHSPTQAVMVQLALSPKTDCSQHCCSKVSQHIGDHVWDVANVFWSRGSIVRSDVVFSPTSRTHSDYVRLADTCSLYNLSILKSAVQKWAKYVLEAAEIYKKTNAQAKAHPVR